MYMLSALSYSNHSWYCEPLAHYEYMEYNDDTSHVNETVVLTNTYTPTPIDNISLYFCKGCSVCNVYEITNTRLVYTMYFMYSSNAVQRLAYSFRTPVAVTKGGAMAGADEIDQDPFGG